MLRVMGGRCLASADLAPPASKRNPAANSRRRRRRPAKPCSRAPLHRDRFPTKWPTPQPNYPVAGNGIGPAIPTVRESTRTSFAPSPVGCVRLGYRGSENRYISLPCCRDGVLMRHEEWGGNFLSQNPEGVLFMKVDRPFLFGLSMPRPPSLRQRGGQRSRPGVTPQPREASYQRSYMHMPPRTLNALFRSSRSLC